MEKYVCKKCGSENIQVRGWINPCSGEVVDWLDEDDCWCNHCMAMSRYIVKFD